MSACEIIGLRIRCPMSGKIVSVARNDFAIGPMNSDDRRYRVRCKCGELHIAATHKVTKPTKARAAQPATNRKQSG